MSLSKHPNVLRVRGSWMAGHSVYIALRLMRKGSVRDVMRYHHIDGVEEEIVKCILKQALQGLKFVSTFNSSSYSSLIFHSSAIFILTALSIAM